MSAGGLAVEHIGAKVVQVVCDRRAQAEVAYAVVAPGVLTLLVTHSQYLHCTCSLDTLFIPCWPMCKDLEYDRHAQAKVAVSTVCLASSSPCTP